MNRVVFYATVDRYGLGFLLFLSILKVVRKLLHVYIYA